MTRPVRVALCADFPEERWPSMDRVANELLAALRDTSAGAIDAFNVCPRFRRRAARWSGGARAADLDRGLNRLVDYPAHVSRIASAFDVFHVVDHSYSQLVHRLPQARTIVTCHDLDTFRSVLEPEVEPRSAPFRAMVRHVLDGFRRAAFVTCDSGAVRDRLIQLDVVPADRLVVAPIGVSPEFTGKVDREADAAAARLLGPATVDLLHVGSTIPRKRIEFLLRIFAAVRGNGSDLRLVRVGGPLTPAQERFARDHALADHIVTLPLVDDRTLAALYRRAAVVLLPSAREGFGLPVVEAQCCGTPVIASDLPVLREVGGAAPVYCAPDDLDGWTRAIAGVLATGADDSWLARRGAGAAWAAQFTWPRFAARMTSLYEQLAERRAVAAFAGAPV